MKTLTVSTHPLVLTGLSRLRDKNTSSDDFRRHVREVSALLFAQASADLETRPVEIETPIERTTGTALSRSVVLVPILRAGLGMVDGVWPLIPTAQVAHIGIYRDEATAKPQPYYSKVPPGLGDGDVFLLDPMLATGQSAVEAVNQLKSYGAKRIRFVCLIATPEGVETFHTAHPEIPITAGALDRALNERSYIVPGLGDAGDRYFGT
jgi:uracil phosphoribosyltransferase